MQIELTITPFPGDGLMDAMDRAMSIMLQDPGISITHFKFNGVQLYLRRNGDPAKVKKYYLKKLPDILRIIRSDVDDKDSVGKIINFLDDVSSRRVVVSDAYYTISTDNRALLPTEDPLIQCNPYILRTNGYMFEAHIKGYSFDKEYHIPIL